MCREVDRRLDTHADSSTDSRPIKTAVCLATVQEIVDSLTEVCSEVRNGFLQAVVGQRIVQSFRELVYETRNFAESRPQCRNASLVYPFRESKQSLAPTVVRPLAHIHRLVCANGISCATTATTAGTIVSVQAIDLIEAEDRAL